MTRLFTTTRLLALIIALLLISAMLPARVAGVFAGPPHALASLLLAPVASQLRALGLRLRPPTADAMLADDNQQWREQFLLQKQYTLRLAEEVEQLRRQLANFQRIASVVGENQHIRFVDARVAANYRNGGKSTLLIDRGRSAGVAESQVVTHGEQLVGVVEQADWKTADVRLITSSEMALKVRVLPAVAGVFAPGTPAPGSAGNETSGGQWIRLNEAGDAFVFQADAMASIKPGDLAHLSDERWPAVAQGFVVGQVVNIKPDPDNPMLYQRVTIKPRFDLASLSEVTVLAPAPAPGSPAPGTAQESEQ